MSEHNMLVDLARNDVGRVAEFGSVTVPEYLRVHRYSKIMHLASVVEGRLRGELDACDALQAILPAGTLSGAPKIRACQIIAELEGRPWGVYGGAVGYLDFSGNMDVCIAIRMAVKQGDKVTVGAGGRHRGGQRAGAGICGIGQQGPRRHGGHGPGKRGERLMNLLIDNYDSFSYNLVQLVGSLIRYPGGPQRRSDSGRDPPYASRSSDSFPRSGTSR